MHRRAIAAGTTLFVFVLAGDHVSAQVLRQNPGNLFRLFSQLDSDGNEQLDRGEIPLEGLDAFETLLKHGDSNRDDRLDVPEFRGLVGRLRGLSPAPSPARQAAFFRARDRNADGVLDRDEFPGPAPVFDRIDSDGSGGLSPEELRQSRDAGNRGGRATRPRRPPSVPGQATPDIGRPAPPALPDRQGR